MSVGVSMQLERRAASTRKHPWKAVLGGTVLLSSPAACSSGVPHRQHTPVQATDPRYHICHLLLLLLIGKCRLYHWWVVITGLGQAAAGCYLHCRSPDTAWHIDTLLLSPLQPSSQALCSHCHKLLAQVTCNIPRRSKPHMPSFPFFPAASALRAHTPQAQPHSCSQSCTCAPPALNTPPQHSTAVQLYRLNCTCRTVASEPPPSWQQALPAAVQAKMRKQDIHTRAPTIHSSKRC